MVEMVKGDEMRPIKFRGWDTRKNVMYSAEEMGQDQLTISTDGRGFINVHGSSTKLSTFPTHIIPMQYTGLKDVGTWPESKYDKDGNTLGRKDIYSHDIVEVVSNNIVADGYAFKRAGQRPNGERFVVSVTGAGHTLIPVDWFDLSKEPYSPNKMGLVNNYNFWNGANNSLRVIGNIHQNPKPKET